MSIFYFFSLFSAWAEDNINTFAFAFSLYYFILGVLFMIKATMIIFSGQHLSDRIQQSKYMLAQILLKLLQ